jgi:hypothetical protein
MSLLARFGLEVHQEAAAADARRLGLHQVEHHLGGDGGVDRAPAPAQNLASDPRRVRVGGCDHVLGGPGRRGLLAPAGGLGSLRLVTGQGRRRQRGEREPERRQGVAQGTESSRGRRGIEVRHH